MSNENSNWSGNVRFDGVKVMYDSSSVVRNRPWVVEGPDGRILLTKKGRRPGSTVPRRFGNINSAMKAADKEIPVT